MTPTKLKFTFTEMHEIAKRAYEVLQDSDAVKLIDTVLDIKENDGEYEVTTYEGIIMKTNTTNTLKLFNVEKYSMKTNDANEYINNVFEGLHNEVEKYYKDKAEMMERIVGKTFDDILKGFRP